MAHHKKGGDHHHKGYRARRSIVITEKGLEDVNQRRRAERYQSIRETLQRLRQQTTGETDVCVIDEVAADRRRDLIRAAALIVAEIERLDRGIGIS